MPVSAIKKGFVGGETAAGVGTYAMAHGLGVVPKVIETFAKCVGAEGGYSVGDSVRYLSSGPSVPLYADTVNVYLSANAFNTTFVQKGLLTTFVPNPANWVWIVKASL